MSLLIVTKLTPDELLERVGPTLETITAIEDWRCVSVGKLIAAKNGTLDPFVVRLPEAWREAERWAQRTKSQHLRQPRSGDILTKFGVQSRPQAAVKMGLRGPWQGKPSPDTSDKER